MWCKAAFGAQRTVHGYRGRLPFLRWPTEFHSCKMTPSTRSCDRSGVAVGLYGAERNQQVTLPLNAASQRARTGRTAAQALGAQQIMEGAGGPERPQCNCDTTARLNCATHAANITVHVP